MPSAGLQVCVKGINHWIYTFAVQAMNVIGSRKSMHIPRALLHHMSVFFLYFLDIGNTQSSSFTNQPYPSHSGSGAMMRSHWLA